MVVSETFTQTEGQAQELRVPLDIPFDVAGTHQYTLHQVYDGLGNTRTLGSIPTSRKPDHGELSMGEFTRSVTVLRRAGVSFKDCGPGKPASLLIGSEAHLQLAARDADPKDGPLAVTVAYRPFLIRYVCEEYIESMAESSLLSVWETVVPHQCDNAWRIHCSRSQRSNLSWGCP